ncbi:hypothetical protein [Pseudarthrobacter sp. S9]|uniref:hypothetical protein n=1 Tax=Pseudarthrobacter sp. S9 TaxID=3418421 RepID=UPI003CFDCDFA
MKPQTVQAQSLQAQSVPAQSASRGGDTTRAAAVRLFSGFAGFGGGAVDLAISSSLLSSAAAPDGAAVAAGAALTVAAGAVAALWGSAVLVWTILTLHRGRLLWVKPAVALLLTAALLHAAGAASGQAIGPASLVVSQLSALLLTLMIVAAAGWLHRQGGGDGVQRGDGPDASSRLRPGRLLLAAFACAVLVAGVATPGLAASTAGQFAVPHGSHGIPGGSHHEH